MTMVIQERREAHMKKHSQKSREESLEKNEKSSVKVKTKKEIKEGRTAQNSIQYDMMMKNGICALPDFKYSSSMRFSDINYQIAPEEDQQSIFSKYMEILNSLGNEQDVQLTINNRIIDKEEFEKNTLMKYKEDDFNEYRKEFNDMMLDNIAVGNNKIISEKMITYTVQEDTFEEASRSLQMLDSEFSNKFNDLGCEVEHMSGYDRLETIYSILNPTKKFEFSYDTLGRNFTTKDAIAPDCFDFKISPHYFKINDRFSRVLYLKNYSTELSDQLIQSLARLEHNLAISFHMTTIPRGRDISLIKTKIAQMESQKMDENKKALRRQYDPDMLPMELRLSLEEGEILLDDVQRRNQRLFECQFLIMINAASEDELKSTQKAVDTAVKKLTCELGTLSWRQEEGLNGILPLGQPVSGLARTLTTSVCAIIMPFTSQELMQKGNSLYYGLNTLTKNMILCDRKKLQNPSGWYLAKPGAGKSFACKREIAQVILKTSDDLIIIDPEREYSKKIAHEFHGSVIRVDDTSGTHLNPFEGDMSQSDFIPTKNAFAQAMAGKIVGGGKLNSIQTSIVERCVRRMYDEYLKKKSDKNNPLKIEMPSLNDFARILREQTDSEAKDMATAFEMYTNDGSYNLFSGQSNVDVNNRLTVYDIFDLPDTLKPLGLLMILESLWNKIISNFKQGKNTWIWLDEIHLLFQDEYSTNFLVALFKRARKFGAIVTGITQNVEDLLANVKIRTMLSNSEFILMLNQSASDRDQLVDLLNISREQMSFITSAQKGSGLLYTGNCLIPFTDNFPKNTKLYEMFTTDFEEKKKLEKGLSLV